MPDNTPAYAGPADFRVTVLKQRKQEDRRSVELHVPGFFTWEMDPQRARDVANELHWAAAEAICPDQFAN